MCMAENRKIYGNLRIYERRVSEAKSRDNIHQAWIDGSENRRILPFSLQIMIVT